MAQSARMACKTSIYCCKNNHSFALHMAAIFWGHCVQKQRLFQELWQSVLVLNLRLCSGWHTVHNILYFCRISTFCECMGVNLIHTKRQGGGKTQEKRTHRNPDCNISAADAHRLDFDPWYQVLEISIMIRHKVYGHFYQVSYHKNKQKTTTKKKQKKCADLFVCLERNTSSKSSIAWWACLRIEVVANSCSPTSSSEDIFKGL